jgi:hypothetical protein
MNGAAKRTVLFWAEAVPFGAGQLRRWERLRRIEAQVSAAFLYNEFLITSRRSVASFFFRPVDASGEMGCTAGLFFHKRRFFWERVPTFVDDKRHKKEKTEPAKTAVFSRFSVTAITKNAFNYEQKKEKS